MELGDGHSVKQALQHFGSPPSLDSLASHTRKVEPPRSQASVLSTCAGVCGTKGMRMRISARLGEIQRVQISSHDSAELIACMHR